MVFVANAFTIAMALRGPGQSLLDDVMSLRGPGPSLLDDVMIMISATYFVYQTLSMKLYIHDELVGVYNESPLGRSFLQLYI